MPVRFDPYHKWLGIPPGEQPANYYRLLGISLFESDRDVISYAADQRMGLLKTFATSSLNAAAENLLNEVARARVCLLSPTKKNSYDAGLREKQGINPQPASVEARMPPGQHQASGSILTATVNAVEKPKIGDSKLTVGEFGEITTRPSDKSSVQNSQSELPLLPSTGGFLYTNRKKKQTSVTTIVGLVMGGIAGLAAGYVYLCHLDLRYDALGVFARNSLPRREEATSDLLDPEPRPKVPLPRQLPAPIVPRRLPNNPPKRPGPRFQNQPPAQPFVPNPPQPVPPNVPRQRNVVLDVPPQLPIPVPDASDGALRLMAVPLKELDSFEITILTGQNAARDHLTLTQLPHVGVDTEWKWRIGWTGDPQPDVASFSIANGQLTFEWQKPNPDAVAALRNSVMKIRANQTDYFSALRNPVMKAPFIFDLDKGPKFVACSCGDLPESDVIRSDILEFQNLPKYVIVGKGLLGLKLGDEIVLQYKEASGATTRIKLTEPPTLQTPALQIDSRYQLPSGFQGSMDLRGITSKLNALSRALSKKEDVKLRNDERALRAIREVAIKLQKPCKMTYRFYATIEGQEIELVKAL